MAPRVQDPHAEASGHRYAGGPDIGTMSGWQSHKIASVGCMLVRADQSCATRLCIARVEVAIREGRPRACPTSPQDFTAGQASSGTQDKWKPRHAGRQAKSLTYQDCNTPATYFNAALDGPGYVMPYFFILLYSVTRLIPRDLAVLVRLFWFLNKACSMISRSLKATCWPSEPVVTS